MYTFGIDIGSTTSKCVVMEDGQNIVGTSLLVGGIGTRSPELAVSQALENAGVTWDDLTATAATGYGRNRYEGADYNVSELSCHGLGAHHTFPTVRTIIDIGGQDAKVISLDEKGRMNNFLMNDKCAAGTGRFLDVMANILVVPVDEFAQYCEKSVNPAQISIRKPGPDLQYLHGIRGERGDQPAGQRRGDGGPDRGNLQQCCGPRGKSGQTAVLRSAWEIWPSA